MQVKQSLFSSLSSVCVKMRRVGRNDIIPFKMGWGMGLFPYEYLKKIEK